MSRETEAVSQAAEAHAPSQAERVTVARRSRVLPEANPTSLRARIEALEAETDDSKPIRGAWRSDAQRS